MKNEEKTSLPKKKPLVKRVDIKELVEDPFNLKK